MGVSLDDGQQSELDLLRQRVACHQQESRTVARLTGALQHLFDRLARVDGKELFERAVVEMGQAIGADFTFVGEALDDGGRVNTVALCRDGVIIPNITYNLQGTPCERVVGRSVCVYERGVVAQFPQDSLLSEMGVDGYAGVPLFDSHGEPLGLIAALYRRPVPDPEFAACALLFFASRIAAVMERERVVRQQSLMTQTAELDRNRMQARTELILNATTEGIMGIDAEGRLVFANPAIATMVGRNPEALIGAQVHRVLHHTHADGTPYAECDCPILRTLTDGISHRGEDVFVRGDGGRFPAEFGTAPILEDGRITGAVVALRDITARKRREEERHRLALAIEQASDTVVITDTAGTLVYVNPAFERTTGYSRAEALGGKPSIVKSGRHDELFYKELWNTILAGKTWKGQFVNRRKDGTEYTEEATISPIRNGDGIIINFMAVKHDVTKELHLLEQLLQAQKMEAVGRLAGGVAHDVNNILAGILATSALLESILGEDREGVEEARAIQTACERGREITRNLLSFSGRGAYVRGEISLNQVVLRTISLLEASFLKRIHVTTCLSDDLYGIEGDSGEVGQAIMNLCINAADAMERNGVLELITRNVECGGRGCVEVLVRDNGSGMDEQTIARAFDPFFTTKPAGKGTGLGLSMVYGTMTRMQGTAKIESKPGEGTTVTLTFPGLTRPARQPSTAPTKPSQDSLPVATILLVDDEAMIVQYAAKLLKRKGHRVLVASTAAAARAVFRENYRQIDIVLLDLVLPDVQGTELFNEFRSINPEARILVTSGFVHDDVVRDLLAAGSLGFIPKPFDVPKLLQTIWDVLPR